MFRRRPKEAKLTKAQAEDCKSAFVTCARSDGFLGKQELFEGLQELGIDFTGKEQEYENFWAAADIDNSGDISEEEFEQAITRILNSESKGGAGAGSSGEKGVMSMATSMLSSFHSNGVKTLQGKYTKMKKALEQSKAELEAATKDAQKYAKQHLQDKLDGIVESTVGRVVDGAVRGATGDPDMPQFLRQAVKAMADDLKPELLDEAMDFVHTQQHLLGRSGKESAEDEREDLRFQSPKGPCSAPYCIGFVRSWILYPLLPYDRTIWSQMTMCSWWLLQIPNLVPLFGIQQLWWCFLYLLLDKSDEFQLVNFIVAFKGAQFLTVGILSMVTGAMIYFSCTLERNCDSDFPGSIPFFFLTIVGFFAQIIATWTAFAFIPCSVKKGHKVDSVRESYNKDGEPCYPCSRYTRYPGRGGRLAKYIYWDIFCVVIVVIVCVVSYDSHGVVEEHKGSVNGTEGIVELNKYTRQTMFFCKCWYGIMMFPFLMFKLPGLAKVLTHTKPTAYNEAGEVVPKLSGKDALKKRAVRIQTNPSKRQGEGGEQANDILV